MAFSAAANDPSVLIEIDGPTPKSAAKIPGERGPTRTFCGCELALPRRTTTLAVPLPTPPPNVRAPKANSLCERFGGTLRRECFDFLIPFQ